MRGSIWAGEAYGVCAGETYFDVGTMDGYAEAMRILADRSSGRRVA